MKIFKNILDLLFVPKCGACFSVMPNGDKALCDECEFKYESERSAKCARCGYPRKYCQCTVKTEENEFPLVHVTGYSTRRDSVSKKMILHVKDDRLKMLLDKIALDMAIAFKFRCSVEMSEEKSPSALTVFECNSENTYITWIPRSKKAYRKAGHDQSSELAKRVSAELGFPIFRAFTNIGKSAQKKLDAENRMKNALKSHVLIADKEIFSGKTVIIIDDIVTTGASIKVCAEQLMESGAAKVVAMTFAQTESYREVYDDMPFVR